MDVPHYRDLFVRGDAAALELAPEAIERELGGGWARDRETEDRAQVTGSTYFVYTCERRDRPFRPSASLFLLPVDGSPPALSCVNVVPRDAHELSHNEYNAIVGEFAMEFVGPVADRLGLEVDLEAPALPFTAYFSDGARAALSAFSSTANKSTGSSHPSDRERWYRFIEQVHNDGGRLDEDVLYTWLVGEGWTPDRASRLVSEATFGLGLLAHGEQADP